MAQDAIINRWDINGDVYDIQDAGRGRPLGVATLDENGRVPYTQLPESAVEFKGYWDASTNTPHLQDGTGTKGDLYYVDVAGTQDLGSGTQEFYVGDRVLYDGSVWKNISGDILEKAQQLFDVVHPIGEIYVQYPQQKSPTDLYNNNGITSTWTLQTQYSGAFFRSSGGSASSFINEGSTLTKQTGQNLSHNHGGATGTESRGHVHYLSGTYGGWAANAAATSTSTVSRPGSRNVAYNGDNADGKIGLGSGMKLQATSDPSTVIKVTTTTTLKNYTSGAHQNHTHTISSEGGTENRPDNFTIQIWKRTA